MKFYGGALEKISRLGMAQLFLELQQILFNTQIEIEPVKNHNGAAVVRSAIDAQFDLKTDWVKTVSGGVDWVKRARYNQTILVRLGVEVQVSARSDLLIRDVVHLRNSLQESIIDVGIIVVPSDLLAYYLTDRTPALRDAIRYIEEDFKEAINYPIAIMAIEHDWEGAALPKRRTNVGKLAAPIESPAEELAQELATIEPEMSE
jgi:hypothetical protein